jgi:hypothetical protein
MLASLLKNITNLIRQNKTMFGFFGKNRITSVEFAKFFLCCANEKFVEMGAVKLHKLLYMCNGFMLAADIDIISEVPRAWLHGPVYPKICCWLHEHPYVFKYLPEYSKNTGKHIEKTGTKIL